MWALLDQLFRPPQPFAVELAGVAAPPADAAAGAEGGGDLLANLFAPRLWAAPKKKPSYRVKRIRQQSRGHQKTYMNVTAVEYCAHCRAYKRQGHISPKCAARGGACGFEEERWAAKRAARAAKATAAHSAGASD